MLEYIVRWISHIVSLAIWADICDNIIHSFIIAQQVTSLAVCTLSVWIRAVGFSMAEPGIIPSMLLGREFHTGTGRWFNLNSF